MKPREILPMMTCAALAFAYSSSCTDNQAGGSVTFTVSGEDVSLTGFAFPPENNDALAFVDGWQVRCDRLLTTVDRIVMSDNPDRNPASQFETGAVVAEARGPWAVDLTKPGQPRDVATASLAPLADQPTVGRGGTSDRSVRLVKIVNQNRNGNRAFDPSVRYAFGFDIVTATAAAQKVNLDADALGDYDTMVQNGYSVLYVGTATFRGGAACKVSSAGYDFSKLPTTVKFRFGFRTPTTYINCQNSDLTGRPFEGEEYQRGIQIQQTAPTFAQLTIHTDHPFWNTTVHDAARVFFDQIAVYAAPDGNVSLDDLRAADFTAFRDPSGALLPWRSCIADVEVPAQPTRSFNAGSTPVNPSAPQGAALRGYGDFMSYLQSTQGHLNADGLCAVQRNYPSPP